MGEDSIRPFLEYEDKWTIVLGLTSNKGANDFEMLSVVGEDNLVREDTNQGSNQGKKLYETVIE